MSKTNVTLTNAVIEFTPAKRFREAIAEGRASGIMRLTGWTTIGGQRLNLAVKFPAPVSGLAVQSPVYEDGSPVIGEINLRNPGGDLECVLVGADGTPSETLTGPDGAEVPATSTCCWAAFGIGNASLEVANISEGREYESGVYADADIAGPITFTRPIDPFGGKVAGIGAAAVLPPTEKMIAAAERRRATRIAKEASAVAF